MGALRRFTAIAGLFGIGWIAYTLIKGEVTLFDAGLADSFRLFDQPDPSFSWWDYRAAGFRRNLGLRIDLILVSEALATACQSSGIDVEPRRLERPSDHTPVWATFG